MIISRDCIHSFWLHVTTACTTNVLSALHDKQGGVIMRFKIESFCNATKSETYFHVKAIVNIELANVQAYYVPV